MVDGVRVVLGFEDESRMPPVAPTSFAGGDVQPVAGVELNARLVRIDFHGSTAGRMMCPADGAVRTVKTKNK